MDFDVLNDFKYFYRCVLLLKNIKHDVTKKEIFRATNDTMNNINLILLLKFLIIKKIIKVDNSRIPYTYNINKKELANFLYNSKFYHDINKINEIVNKLTYCY